MIARFRLAAAPLVLASLAAQPAAAREAPSPERLRATVATLVSFGTRHSLSSATDPRRGIGASRNWVAGEFARLAKACGGCLATERLSRRFVNARAPDGVVIEAQLDKGRGPVATVLVQRGTLNVGDIFVAGNEWGRVRAMLDSHGEQVKQAGPSEPVEILGLNGTPAAGDEFTVVESEARAREVADYRQRVARDKRTQLGAPATLEQMFADIEKGDKQQLPVVVKADVQGSVEAIVAAAESLNTEEVEVRVLHAAVGGITESDVTLAQASGAVIMGFSVRANAQARDLAKQNQTEIRYYSVIYELVDDLKAAMSGLLAPKIEETVLGGAEVLEVFGISKIGKIAGCRITEGLVRADARARLIRDDVVIYTGDLKSLRRFQDEAREVREGQECGIGLTNYQDIQKGDRMEFFEVEEIERSL